MKSLIVAAVAASAMGMALPTAAQGLGSSEAEHVGGPLDYYQWTSILRSVSALTAYHWVYRETLKPWLIADLLILNNSLPRSLASCYENLVRNLDQIGVAELLGTAQHRAGDLCFVVDGKHPD